MVLPYHISLSLQTLFFQGWNSFALAFICIQSLTMKKIGCHHFLSEKVINGIAECNYPINQSQGKQIIFGMCMVQENKYILRIILACAFYHLTLLPNQHMTLPPPPHLSIVIFLSWIFIVSLQSRSNITSNMSSWHSLHNVTMQHPHGSLLATTLTFSNASSTLTFSRLWKVIPNHSLIFLA